MTAHKVKLCASIPNGIVNMSKREFKLACKRYGIKTNLTLPELIRKAHADGKMFAYNGLLRVVH